MNRKKNLSPCALAILNLLDEEQGQTMGEVVVRLEELGKPFTNPAVSSAFRQLLKARLCWRGPNREDMGNPMYYLSPRGIIVKDELSGGLWRWNRSIGWYPIQERKMRLGEKSYLGLLMCKLGQHPAWEWLNLRQQDGQARHMKCVRCGKEKWVLGY